MPVRSLAVMLREHTVQLRVGWGDLNGTIRAGRDGDLNAGLSESWWLKRVEVEDGILRDGLGVGLRKFELVGLLRIPTPQTTGLTEE